jgi:iron-sulfur cluster assembly accessory protein
MIRVTDKAKEKIISVLIEENATFLRFGLQGGGCNGFSYFISIETVRDDSDFALNLDDTRILLVDPMSGMYLENAEIDYKKDLMGESFVFNNPNQKTSCGCGSSVSF